MEPSTAPTAETGSSSGSDQNAFKGAHGANDTGLGDDPPPPQQRSRWATRKMTVRAGRLKRLSLGGRKPAKPGPAEKADTNKRTDSNRTDQSSGDGAAAPSSRMLFFNLDLPEEYKHEDGRPRQRFPRNKIRTAKYTPLSFIPKNLWLQFHNIANSFFLFLVILVFFPVFGGANPGLNSVPLIIIITITAIKDAVEDYRRTVLDNVLNNAPVHRLTGWTNVNVEEDNVSAWRQFKKLNSRLFGALWHLIHGLFSKKAREEARQRRRKRSISADEKHDPARPSFETALGRPDTSAGRRPRSLTIAGEEIPMTPVPSPGPTPMKKSLLADRKDQAETEDERRARRIRGLTPDVLDHSAPGRGAKFHPSTWKSLTVGDFVRIYSDDELPADVLILATSDPDGACYVETKNLDGETNLKVRQALRCGRKLRHARDCERAKFSVESEEAQPNLYRYNGAVRWTQPLPREPANDCYNDIKGARDPEGGLADHHPDLVEMTEPVGIDNLLLRGCNLRNTEWVLGIVLFTGHETKIMMNAGVTPSKRPRIAREMNYHVICNFAILLVMCILAWVVNASAWGSGSSSIRFFDWGPIGSTPILTGFIDFWAALILFQNLVPISLYVTLEIVRTLQAFFIYSDVEMYDPVADEPCVPKAWNISDDLGQIEYVFSDKTGTLTQNVMEFRKATINGQPYGEAYTEAQAGMRKRMGVDVDAEAARVRAEIAAAKTATLDALRRIHDNPYLHDDELTFVAPDFVADLAAESGEEQRAANERFMLALALCHSVIAERTPAGRIAFRAQSPDEAALVATARDMGFVVLGNGSSDNAAGGGAGAGAGSLRLAIMGRELSFPVLNTIEFNSTRKRMSAIVRMPDGRIVLFCKGADTVIYSRLRPGDAAEREMRLETARHLEMFAREGLRTLCIAERELTEREYYAWQLDHDAAAAAIEGREEKLEAVADRIERDLTLLGGTAIEDRLQDGVPDTIALLMDAGIKLWVLTGDKVETAINIGFSCNLLNTTMQLITLKLGEEEEGDGAAAATPPVAVDSGGADHSSDTTDTTSVTQVPHPPSPPINTAAAAAAAAAPSLSYEDRLISELGRLLDENLATFGLRGDAEDLAAARKDHRAPASTHALVIDGFTLKTALDPSLRIRFLLLCKQCRAVLCCRVSPAQKAAVVTLVKSSLDVMTLAVGDGANDVAMIQEADVGVGIAGLEGRQASMSSDYAIAQFRFLRRLILVHGRWSYRRLAEAIPNFFYKNMVWTFAIFWFQPFCDFDMTDMFDYSYILMFNLVFTSLPVGVMGVLDQDVSDRVSLAVPQLYRRGIERLEWTPAKFWLYMADGIYQSIMAFFVPYLAVVLTSSSVAGSALSGGRNIEDLTRFGAYVAHPAVVTINFYILMNTYRWDWLMLVIVAFSDLFVFLWTGAYSAFGASGRFYGAAPQVYSEASFWVVFFLVPVVCLLPRFAAKAIQKVYFPRDIDIVREMERLGRFKNLDRDGRDHPGRRSSDSPGGGGAFDAAGNPMGTLQPESTSANDSSVIADGKHADLYHQNNTHNGFDDDDDSRPMYRASVATNSTANGAMYRRSHHGSDSTTFTTGPRDTSIDMQQQHPSMHPDFWQQPTAAAHYAQQHEHPPSVEVSGPEGSSPAAVPQQGLERSATLDSIHRGRPSIDRARPSYDRMRHSMEPCRVSFEASSDFTSAARLSRIESRQSSVTPRTSRLRGLSLSRRGTPD